MGSTKAQVIQALYIQWVALRPSTVLSSQVLPNKAATASRLKANEVSRNEFRTPFRNPKHTLTTQTEVLTALFHNNTVPNFSLLIQQSPRRWDGGGGAHRQQGVEQRTRKTLCSQPQCSDLGGRVPAFQHPM